MSCLVVLSRKRLNFDSIAGGASSLGKMGWAVPAGGQCIGNNIDTVRSVQASSLFLRTGKVKTVIVRRRWGDVDARSGAFTTTPALLLVLTSRNTAGKSWRYGFTGEFTLGSTQFGVHSILCRIPAQVALFPF